MLPNLTKTDNVPITIIQGHIDFLAYRFPVPPATQENWEMTTFTQSNMIPVFYKEGMVGYAHVLPHFQGIRTKLYLENGKWDNGKQISSSVLADAYENRIQAHVVYNPALVIELDGIVLQRIIEAVVLCPSTKI